MAFATIHLDTGSDLTIETEGGDLSYGTLFGTTFENFIVNAGSGTAYLGNVPDAITINNYDITAGQIVLEEEVFAINVDLVSGGSILNEGVPQAINSTNSATFNAEGGNVGSNSSPILIYTMNEIFAGAGGAQPSLADFDGASVDNTIHSLSTDPPCIIIFNGIELYNCGAKPPSPSVLPSAPRFSFPFPEVESSFFNLSSDLYFLPGYLDRAYFRSAPPPIRIKKANGAQTAKRRQDLPDKRARVVWKAAMKN